MKKASTASILLLIFASTLQAHPGHSDSGLLTGALHPLTGLDHLLAMLAVGLWAAQMGGRALWMVPCAFVSSMILGGFLGMEGLMLPYLEQGIALSVLLLGLLITFAIKAPVYLPAALVAAFALFHGVAHGAEMPATASGLTFAMGFVGSTALLHLAGIGLGMAMQKTSTALMLRGLGLAVALAGTYQLLA